MVLHKRTSLPQTNLWLTEGIWCLRIQVIVEDAIELRLFSLSSTPARPWGTPRKYLQLKVKHSRVSRMGLTPRRVLPTRAEETLS